MVNDNDDGSALQAIQILSATLHFLNL